MSEQIGQPQDEAQEAACALRAVKPMWGALQGVDLESGMGRACPAEARLPELSAQEEE